jgi:hypothetical protein
MGQASSRKALKSLIAHFLAIFHGSAMAYAHWECYSAIPEYFSLIAES